MIDNAKLTMFIHRDLRLTLTDAGWLPARTGFKLPQAGRLALPPSTGKRVVELVAKRAHCGYLDTTTAPEILKMLAQNWGYPEYAAAVWSNREALDELEFVLAEVVEANTCPDRATGVSLLWQPRRFKVSIAPNLNEHFVLIDWGVDSNEGDLHFILPTEVVTSLLGSSFHQDYRELPLDALFADQAEAEATLGLWTPGSGDEWSSFKYAHRTAKAL